MASESASLSFDTTKAVNQIVPDKEYEVFGRDDGWDGKIVTAEKPHSYNEHFKDWFWYVNENGTPLSFLSKELRLAESKQSRQSKEKYLSPFSNRWV